MDPRVKIILDVKTPDSGEGKSFLRDNLNFCPPQQTEFKFVICSESDFYWAEQFVEENQLANSFSILYSPSFEQISEKWLAKKILSVSHPIRLQLQMHKYIWSPEEVGV